MDHLSYMQLCRLCLVKDKVNVPIFDDANDVRQIFLKITACLPVKVSRDDNLPKKICNECLYKIDSLYQFWNTTINAEKQLLQWLNEIGVDTTVTNAAAPLQQILPQSHAHPHTEEIILKEEALEDLKPEHNNIIFPSYIPNQQQPPPPNLTKFQPADEEEEDDPPRRRTRGRPAKKKAASVLEAALTAQDSDSVDSDRLADGGADDSDYVDEERVTKEEVDSDEDYVDPLEPTQFVNVSNDAEQPGPSGLNNTAKSTTTLQPPTHTDTGSQQKKKDKTKKLLQSAGSREYKCTECTKCFDNPSNLRRHLFIHKPNGIFECDICSKKFKYQQSLNWHKHTHTDNSFKCEICLRVYVHLSLLKQHYKMYPPENDSNCQFCPLKFHSQSELKLHEYKSHLVSEMKCYICKKIFKQSDQLKSHMSEHPEHESGTFQCEYCAKVFPCKLFVKKHIQRTHMQVQEKICDICGKRVSSKTSLRDHLLVHSGQKPIECDQCGKRFAKKNSLVVHLRVHSGEKPFKCQYCDKTFAQRSPMVLHERRHTGNKPYDCEICQEKFVSKNYLTYHKKSKHKMITL